MTEVQLGCAVYGEGTVFPVKIARDATVSVLQEAISDILSTEQHSVPPRLLTLYLARKEGGAWLKDDCTVNNFLKGDISTDYKEMRPLWKLSREELLGPDFQPRRKEIHVLVELPDRTVSHAAEPTEIVVKIKEDQSISYIRQELIYYQQRGQLLQERCIDYCAQVLDKIDMLYEENESPLPFICVEGSSGMGKSQLAFALGGRRPWYYWLASTVNPTSQRLYRSFGSLSGAFHSCVTKDNPTVKNQDEILNTCSSVYINSRLFTYGFICALLEHCSSKKHQSAQQMIRFVDETTFNVKACDLDTIRAVIDKMKAEKKKLPFFILDEMDIKFGGVNTAAFQRNVFRACGLVVIIMGTDSKIANFMEQVWGAYNVRHKWMVLVPRLPSYQITPYTPEEKQLVEKYPVVIDILTGSRGRFARYFMEQVVKSFNQSSEIKLSRLLNEGFDHVSKKTHEGKVLLSSLKGKFAQLVAISYTNAVVCRRNEAEPPRKMRRLEVGTFGMHLHFANLIDDKVKDLDVWAKDLYTKDDNEKWKPTCCFPSIDKDVLLYLAILGGKTYSSYYDFESGKQYSTKWIFTEVPVYPVHKNSNSVSYNYESYENMVSHAIFSSSRRNGVEGIQFNDFFECLLGEFLDELWKKVQMQCRETGHVIQTKDLFKGYAENVTKVLDRSIPFLAPPNAEWPKFILDMNRHGCKFGHLIRAPNDDRCDIYVQDVGNTNEKAIFLCEYKYWDKNVDMSAMGKIIDGLSQEWHWEVGLVFCMELANFGKEWENLNIGCVKVSCQEGFVDWIYRPEEGKRERLLIIVETGQPKVKSRPKTKKKRRRKPRS